MKIKIMFFCLSSLFSVTTLAETVRGTFEFANATWHSFDKFNGPVVAENGQASQMEVIGGFHRGAAFAFNSTNSLVPNNTEFANEAIIYVERVGDSVTLKGRYRYIDNDGDQFHGLIRRNQGTIKAAGASGNGISVISGGTGKYEGIRGKCPYDVFYKPQGYMVVPSKCSWLLKR